MTLLLLLLLLHGGGGGGTGQSVSQSTTRRCSLPLFFLISEEEEEAERTKWRGRVFVCPPSLNLPPFAWPFFFPPDSPSPRAGKAGGFNDHALSLAPRVVRKAASLLLSPCVLLHTLTLRTL